jgi:hypothetical protein
MIIPQVNRVIIPENPQSYPNKYVAYPVSKIKLVYFMGDLINVSLTFKR